MAQDKRHWMSEPDIGSGEKSAAQQDIEREERALGVEREGIEERPDGEGGRILRSGNHLARVAIQRQDDGSYEGQVYVRLAREPEVAETYIPAGSFPTEDEARTAALERAERALREQEF